MISFKSLFNYFHTGFNFYTGGGGSSGPTTSTVNQTNIPEYAQPYVEGMLGSAQQQIYNINDQGNITGFKPYQAYSENPQDYFAGFSPMQQQAQQSTAGLQVPGQFGQGTQLAGMSGIGSLQTAGQAGQAGNQYNQMATNPNATQAFMNPYVQSSLVPQLDEMRRQYGITGTQQAGQATQAGAFGGSRDALMASENNRNMNTAMNQAIGSGYDKAFQAAQQAQQFGANLGLQGQQAALTGYGQAGQAANTLGQLGTSQLGAEQGIINAQNTMGGQQQAQQQGMINQAISNYATAQQYPMMQLGNMSNLLHGLPLEATTRQSYQAPPSGINQLAGIGTSLLGASKLAAKGGVMKSYAGGGITSLENRQRIAENYTPQMLQQSVQRGVLPQSIGTALSQDYANQQQAVQNMQQATQAAQQAAQPSQGVTALPSNLPVTGMAQGGIIAFDNGGEVQHFASKGSVKADPSGWDYEPVAPDYTQADAMIAAAKAAAHDMEGVAKERTAEEGERGITDIYTPMLAKLQEKQAGLEGKRNNALAMSLIGAGGEMMASTSPYAGVGIGEGIKKGVSDYGSAMKDVNALEENYNQQDNTIAMAQNAYKEAALTNDTNRMDKAKATINAAITNKQAIEAKFREQQDAGMLKGAETRAAYKKDTTVAGINASKERNTDASRGIGIIYNSLISPGPNGEPPKMQPGPQAQAAALKQYQQDTGMSLEKLMLAQALGAGKLSATQSKNYNDALAKDNAYQIIQSRLSMMNEANPKYPELKAKAEEMELKHMRNTTGTTTPAAASNPGKDEVQSTPTPTPSTVAYMTNPTSGKSEPIVVKGGKWVWQKSGKAVD